MFENSKGEEETLLNVKIIIGSKGNNIRHGVESRMTKPIVPIELVVQSTTCGPPTHSIVHTGFEPTLSKP